MFNIQPLLSSPGVSVCASVFTLMALSLDRFLAIWHPITLRSFSSGRYTWAILVVLWVVSVAVIVPLFVVRRVNTFPLSLRVDPVHFCTEVINVINA